MSYLNSAFTHGLSLFVTHTGSGQDNVRHGSCEVILAKVSVWDAVFAKLMPKHMAKR